jgi:hypothetical protein
VLSLRRDADFASAFIYKLNSLKMPECRSRILITKALFLISGQEIIPDFLFCQQADNGKPCPHAAEGSLEPIALTEKDSPDKGNPGDLCPPCAKQQLANLGHWQGHGQQTFPEELLPLRLFKCRMWFWFVIPGLYDI